MNNLTLLSPAKVNLSLEVLNQRRDGYHNIRSLLLPISLYDQIEISLKGEGIQVFCTYDSSPLPCGSCKQSYSPLNHSLPQGQDNIAYTAAQTLLESYTRNIGIEIRIKKRIPLAAGLGAGSSNAASVLMGINQLLNLNLSEKELLRIGRKLGADVPFFIFRHPALATGIGEKLEKIEFLPRIWLVLVNPNFPLSTAWVYKNLNRGLTKTRSRINNIPACIKSIEEINKILSNDLERVVISSYPVVKEIKEELKKRGAQGVLMSGSGPTVFGIFGDKEEADKVFTSISNDFEWGAFLVHNLF